MEGEISTVRAFDVCGWAGEEAPVTPFYRDVFWLEVVWVDSWAENTARCEVIIVIFFVGFQSAALIVAGEQRWVMTNSASWSVYNRILQEAEIRSKKKLELSVWLGMIE